MNKLKPIKEQFVGTNGIDYKHVYYTTIANTNKYPIINPSDKHQVSEIGDIGWFSYEEAIKIIRPHHIDRKTILTQLYLYIINSIIDIVDESN